MFSIAALLLSHYSFKIILSLLYIFFCTITYLCSTFSHLYCIFHRYPLRFLVTFPLLLFVVAITSYSIFVESWLKNTPCGKVSQIIFYKSETNQYYRFDHNKGPEKKVSPRLWHRIKCPKFFIIALVSGFYHGSWHLIWMVTQPNQLLWSWNLVVL